MRTYLHGIALLALIALVAACGTLPRGAGLESEVLQTGGFEQAGTPDFVVAPITRDLLVNYDRWPKAHENSLPWISRSGQPANRIIAKGDKVAITIWNTEDNALLTAPGQRFVTLPEMLVSASGTIFLPYLGEIAVSGMSPERARARIQESYAGVMPSAQVQLGLAEGRQSSVSLVGGVGRPGSYPLPDQSFTVMGLIAEGGGVAAALNNPQVRLQRGSQIYGISVQRLMGNPRLDTTLVGGDKVFVEKDDRYFLSLGAAGTEAVHVFPKDTITAIEALSLVGGVSDTRANAKGILILREYPFSALRFDDTGPTQQRVIFTVDLTSADGLFSAGQFQIRSGDLVYATESPIIGAQTILGLIRGAVGLSNQIAN